MGDTVDQGIVAFLTAQLKESHDEIQRLNQENESLREQLGRLDTDGLVLPSVTTDSPVTQLLAKIEVLRKERDEAFAVAATRQQESNTWRIRYEQLKPQLAASAVVNLQLLDTVTQELVQFLAQQPEHPDGEDPADFHAFMTKLPGTRVPESFEQESRVIFKGVTKLPLLSKAAVKACIGGFAFFGNLLVWCTPPSQHACVVFPENEYNPKPTAQGASTWSKTTLQWAAFAGQQRELFYIDGENISYAGTFICHAGPKGANVSEIGDTASSDETLVSALAKKTLHLDTKNPKTRSNLVKTYAPLLADLYRDSSSPVTVQLLGLQRVGFNQTLFDILTTSSKKRRRAAAFAELFEEYTGSDGSGSPTKRAALGSEDVVAMEGGI